MSASVPEALRLGPDGADAVGASDPVLQDTQLPLLVGDLYPRLLVEEADARDEP